MNPVDLTSSNRQWEVCTGGRLNDTPDIYSDDTRFRFPQCFRNKDNKLAIDYFMSSFSRKSLESIVEATNEELGKYNYEVTNKTEILKFLGIRLAMCIDPLRGSVYDYWKDKYDEDSVFVPRCAEKRFGM